MKKMRNFISGLLVLFVAVTLSACGGTDDGGKVIGVSMPTQSLQRWNQDGANMKEKLEESGYQVELEYAENEIQTQVSQIENMVTKGAEVIVVAAVDGGALTSVLEDAKAAGVEVIAYDRLLLDTDAVSYYATFDNFKVGAIQGQYIVDALGLEDTDESFNLEIGTGPYGDTTANFFYDGAMSVLEPYLDNGQLVVKSGQVARQQTATDHWDEQEAQSRLDNILTAEYTDATLDAYLASNDSISLGAQSALKSAGYGTDGKPMPVITGQDANISNVKAIISGDQSMSIFKDTRALTDKVVDMVDGLMNDEEVEVNDTESYDNNVKVVPAFLLEPKAVDLDNYEELLIDSGYYSMDELE